MRLKCVWLKGLSVDSQYVSYTCAIVIHAGSSHLFTSGILLENDVTNSLIQIQIQIPWLIHNTFHTPARLSYMQEAPTFSHLASYWRMMSQIPWFKFKFKFLDWFTIRFIHLRDCHTCRKLPPFHIWHPIGEWCHKFLEPEFSLHFSPRRVGHPLPWVNTASHSPFFVTTICFL